MSWAPNLPISPDAAGILELTENVCNVHIKLPEDHGNNGRNRQAENTLSLPYSRLFARLTDRTYKEGPRTGRDDV